MMFNEDPAFQEKAYYTALKTGTEFNCSNDRLQRFQQ
jgi:hypothetical protein